MMQSDTIRYNHLVEPRVEEDAIRSNQKQSEAIRYNHLVEPRVEEEAIRCS